MTSASPTGGQSAIAGFLFQILRSVQLGIRVSAELHISDDDESENAAMRLTLEPDNGGDHQLQVQGGTSIEQIKMRASHRTWSPGDIAREVLRERFFPIF